METLLSHLQVCCARAKCCFISMSQACHSVNLSNNLACFCGKRGGPAFKGFQYNHLRPQYTQLWRQAEILLCGSILRTKSYRLWRNGSATRSWLRAHHSYIYAYLVVPSQTLDKTDDEPWLTYVVPSILSGRPSPKRSRRASTSFV